MAYGPPYRKDRGRNLKAFRRGWLSEVIDLDPPKKAIHKKFQTIITTKPSNLPMSRNQKRKQQERVLSGLSLRRIILLQSNKCNKDKALSS